MLIISLLARSPNRWKFTVGLSGVDAITMSALVGTALGSMKRMSPRSNFGAKSLTFMTQHVVPGRTGEVESNCRNLLNRFRPRPGSANSPGHNSGYKLILPADKIKVNKNGDGGGNYFIRRSLFRSVWSIIGYMALIGMTKAAQKAQVSRTTIRKDLKQAGLLVEASPNAFLVNEEDLDVFLRQHGPYQRGRPPRGERNRP